MERRMYCSDKDIITIKDIVVPDYINYKKPSMFVIMPRCSFKCDKENGDQYCQNWQLSKKANIEVSVKRIVEIYHQNEELIDAVVFGGLEPFDSFDDLRYCISTLRLNKIGCDCIIYTGYDKNEIGEQLKELVSYGNIIVKYGRYRPHQNPHRDELLGVDLASDNQYAERLC